MSSELETLRQKVAEAVARISRHAPCHHNSSVPAGCYGIRCEACGATVPHAFVESASESAVQFDADIETMQELLAYAERRSETLEKALRAKTELIEQLLEERTMCTCEECVPPSVPDSPQAVAWAFELATKITDRGEYVGWEKRLSRNKPTAPNGSVRNIEPLYYIADNLQLVEACIAAYRKHHLGDDSIGWDELSVILSNAIVNALGPDSLDQFSALQDDL